MIESLNTAHDAEAFHTTLRQYAVVVRDYIKEHGEPPGEHIYRLMSDADQRHMEMIDLLVSWSDVDRGHVVTFLQTALRLATS